MKQEMNLLEIDESKCRQDGLCVKGCSLGIIRLRNDTGFPETIPGAESVCTRCGHCVALCPHGALSHALIPLDECPAIDKGLIVNEAQVVQLLRSRRAVRDYRKRPVESEKIRKLIEIARYAPTGGNAQLVEWLVVTDKKRLNSVARQAVEFTRKLCENPERVAAAPYLKEIVEAWDAGHDHVLWKAPCLIVASAPPQAVYGMVDLVLALSYLELAAQAFALGTCWAGILQGALLASPSLRDTLEIPSAHPHYYSMMLGYHKERYYRLPTRKPPKITFIRR